MEQINNNTNYDVFDFQSEMHTPLPPPLPLLRGRSIHHSQLSINYSNNKISIIKKALLNTYQFIDKLKSIKKDSCKIDLVLVLFNDHAKIFSTIDLPSDKKEYPLITAVKKCEFLEFKNIIEHSLNSCGGTNFFAVKQANRFIDSNVNSVESIKYLLSDGFHNSTIQYPTDRITEDHIKFSYSLGIGNESQYDKKLMENMAENFVQGNDEHDVYDSIIGDTFGSVSIFAKDVEISIYTTANEIKSNKNIQTIKTNVEFDKSLFSISKTKKNQFVVSNIDNNIVRINCSNSIDFNDIDKDLLFIFYVDISGSMSDMITTSTSTDIHSVLSDNLIVPSDNEQINATEEIKKCKSDDIIYNKFTLSKINKFNTFNEEYFICNSNDPIYVEIKTKNENYYFVCNSDNKESEYLPKDTINLVNKYCYLMTELNSLKSLSYEDRKKSIDELSMLVKSPEYVISKKSLDDKSEKSQIDMYFLASINQILRLHAKSSIHSNCLDYVITTAELSIARNVSATTSRQYSCDTADHINDFKQNIEYDHDSMMCAICTNNPRSVLYDCGHCIACKSCTEEMFFAKSEPYHQINNLRFKTQSIDEAIICVEEKMISNNLLEQIEVNSFENKIIKQLQSCPKKCPLCRHDIKHIKLIESINNTGIKCNQEKCFNFANYISSNCNHVTYCKICWKNKFHSSINNIIICPCGLPISKCIKIFT